MAKAFALNRLPKQIRTELLKRRDDKPGLTLDEHVQWFAKKGHKVSRSAIYRFLNDHDTKQLPDEPTGNQSIRLGCLMVAAGFCTPGDEADLLHTADRLEDWVNTPTEPA